MTNCIHDRALSILRYLLEHKDVNHSGLMTITSSFYSLKATLTYLEEHEFIFRMNGYNKDSARNNVNYRITDKGRNAFILLTDLNKAIPKVKSE